MPDTLSPTAMPTYDYQHSAYQRLLLAEMGITPWVGQSQPVQVFSEEALFENLFTEHTPRPFASQPIVLPEKASEATPLLNPIHHSPTHSPTQSPTPVVVNHSKRDEQNPPVTPTGMAMVKADYPTPPVLSSHPQDSLIVRCHCYAIKIQNWVILADVNILNQHPQALQLWQNIIHNLSATPYEFRFPLLETAPDVDAGNVALLAQASFAGFLCLLERNTLMDNHSDSPFTKNQPNATQTAQKVGIVTPIPDWLENDQIRRLPYLSEMLEDYRQKRQFWQLMIANEP